MDPKFEQGRLRGQFDNKNFQSISNFKLNFRLDRCCDQCD